MEKGFKEYQDLLKSEIQYYTDEGCKVPDVDPQIGWNNLPDPAKRYFQGVAR